MEFTSTQKDLDAKSVSGLHIQPSILEGSFMYPSTYVTRLADPLFREPPLNLVPPRITGDTQIPGTMKCEPGQWQGAPYPKFLYQWMSDGDDIPGATGAYWESTSEYHDTDITVEVKGYSRIGESYAWTAPVHITLIETIDLQEVNVLSHTGMGADMAQTQLDYRNLLVSGVGAYTAETVLRSVLYFHTGWAAEERQDMNISVVNIMEGISADARFDALETEVNLLWLDVGYPLILSEPQEIRLTNGDASLGTFSWDVFGSATYNKNSAHGIYTPNSFDNYFIGGYDVIVDNIPYTTLSQVVTLDDIWLDDIDNTNTYVEVTWYQQTKLNQDKGNIYIEFLNSNDQIIGSNSGPGLWAASDIWTKRTFEVAIPYSTKKIRYVIEFSNTEGSTNYSCISNVTSTIRMGDKDVLRNYGPAFQYWRLRFTEANNHSGGSFQELEFYDSSGLVIPMVGGASMAGSISTGTDVNYLYDGIINNGGYWAGENGSIAEGSSWVGYDFNTDVEVSRVNMTANLSNANDMPLSFVLEGSADGYIWVPCQSVTNIPVPSGAEELEIDFFDSGSTILPYIEYYEEYSTNNDNNAHSLYGNLVTSKVRMDVTSMRAYFKNAVTNSGKLVFIRWDDDQVTNGAVTEVLAEVDFSSELAGWVSVPVPSIEIEVGDRVAAIVVMDDSSISNIGWGDVSESTIYDNNPVVDVNMNVYSNSDIFLGMKDFNKSEDRFFVDFGGTIFQ